MRQDDREVFKVFTTVKGSSKLGMKVKATGTVTEAEGRKTITVTSVTEVQ